MRYLVPYQLFLTCLVVPIFIFPTVNLLLTTTAYIVVAVLWANRRLVTGQFSQSTPVDLSLICLLLILPLNFWASVDPAESGVAVSRIIGGLILFYAIVNGIQQKKDLYRLLWLLLLGGAFIALVSLFTTDWRENKMVFLGPIYDYLPQSFIPSGVLVSRTGGLFHPNIIAVTLGMIFPLALSLQATMQTRWGRWELSALLVWMGFVLLLTQSRLAIAALCLSLWGMFMSTYPWGWRLTGLGLGLGISVFFFAGPDLVLAQFLDLFFATGTETWLDRQEVWQNGLQALSDFPFTGVGLAMFEPVSRALYPYFRASLSWQFGHAHNIFVQAGLDFGLGGLVAYLSLLIGLVWTGIKAYLMSQEPFRSVIRGILGSFGIYLGFGLFDALPFWVKSGLLPWIIFALIIVCGRIASEDRQCSPIKSMKIHGD